MDTALVLSSTVVFAMAFALSLRGLRRPEHKPSPARMTLMGLGFALQCGFLYLRGQAAGRCPLTNGSEVLVFVSWAIVLLYLLVGPAYHISLLGFFTAPLVMLFQSMAMLLPGLKAPPVPHGPVDFWLELHAAISLVAYGAFALAFVAGIMFLIQDRQLKRGQMKTLFYNLPPVHYLGKVIVRLLSLGFVLLTVGVVAAFMMENRPGTMKLVLSCLVWLVYAVVLGLYFARGWGNRTAAVAAVTAFAFPVITYWVITQPATEG